MNGEDFIKEAQNMGYTLTAEVDSLFTMKRERSDGKRSVQVIGLPDGSVQIEMETEVNNKYARYVLGDLWSAFKKLRDVDQEVFADDNSVMRDPESIRAARLIHEVRTIRLGPDDKLLINVSESENVDADMLRLLGESVSRWLGDKGQHRVLITKGAEFARVRDATKNPEEKSS